MPAFLLQGFTLSGKREDYLWVHDRKEAKRWRAKPGGAAFERDYYRVDIQDVEPNIVEAVLGKVESQAAAVLQEISRTKELPQGDGLEVLIQFVTLLALRTPSTRGVYERSMEHFTKKSAQIFMSRREFFDQFVEDSRRDGRELPPEVDFESLRDFVDDEDAYRVRISRTESVKMLLEMWQGMLPVFLQRQWSLFNARPSEAHLICSDSPVSITPTRPDFPLRFLGFGLKETELTVPLSRSIALIGSYETPSTTAEIPLEFVRQINLRTISFAERFLYSAEDGFPE